ncbi:AMP-binding protein, partial [Desulfovibrio sp. OttesenSCG-928-C06]|nr:AMP-binding protein [Desulfovibrio sp. OttesenSCG-928-C06]
MAEAFFYFFSSFAVLCITNLGKVQLGLSMTVTSLLSVALMLGVCIGSLIAGRWPVAEWHRRVIPAGLCMCAFLALSSLLPLFGETSTLAASTAQAATSGNTAEAALMSAVSISTPHLALLFALLAITGIFGGMYLIPVVSYIQVAPAAHEKGKVLGISNFACFVGIMLSGPLFGFLLEPEFSLSWNGDTLFAASFESLRGLTPAMLMGGAGICGLLALALARGSLKRAVAIPGNPAANVTTSGASASVDSSGAVQQRHLGNSAPGFAGRLLRILLSLRYRISVNGAEKITLDNRPIIFAPNHPALVDPLITYSVLSPARPRPLADANRMSGLWGKLADVALKVVKIPDLSSTRNGSTQTHKNAITASLSSSASSARLDNPDKTSPPAESNENGTANAPANRLSEAGRGVQEGLDLLANALESGDSVLFYPSGRIYRSQSEVIGGNSGLTRLLEAAPQARLVLVRSRGIWGSRSSWAGAGGNPGMTAFLLGGLATLLGNLLFFTPRRKVEVELLELPASQWPLAPAHSTDRAEAPQAASPSTTPLKLDRKVLNRKLEAFYNEDALPALSVPRHFLFGSQPRELAEPASGHGGLNHAGPDFVSDTNPDTNTGTSRGLTTDISLNISEETRQKVYAVLREAARQDEDFSISDNMLLNVDLDLDSLAMMEVVLGLEEALDVTIDEPEKLASVGDCLLAVSGLLREAEQQKPVPASWFAAPQANSINLDILDGTIPDAFLALAIKYPNEIIAADRSGARTRRELLTAALVLAKRFRKLPGKRIGLMLPAAPAALGVWLAAMLAGKETVFLNWTVGEANLRHCLRISGVETILTSGLLLERLERQGLDFSRLPASFLRLEELGTQLSLAEKLRGALKARFVRSFRKYNVTNTAAILFTSGSESVPKGVPLSHLNLLTNASDAIRALGLTPEEKIVAMLPPFHSFGLLADLVLPLAYGLKAAFHANPTESGKLSALIRDFGLTLLPATPTFLEAIIERSRNTENLSSLRFAFAGAEKCPAHVYRAFARQCTQAALCEGYGITECSPVVAVNRPGDAVEGTIGHALPSVETALVLEEDGVIKGPAVIGKKGSSGEAPGETGMLLVRGPSIFSGYLRSEDSAADGEDAPASPFVEYDGKSWYRTGDLVSIDETGRITFRGRLKRFVKIGGEMISLPQIESILLTAFADHPELPQNKVPGAKQEGPFLAVEAASEEYGAEITLFTTLPLSLGEANAALRKAGLGPLSTVKRLLKTDAIPVLGTGKTDYRALKLR